MVHVNLMSCKKKRKEALIPILISVCFLGLILLLFPFFSDQEPQFRPLILEEQEVVMEVLGRLDSRMPEFSNWTEIFRDKIIDNTFISSVKKDNDKLVSYSDKNLYFSKDFFNSDSATQENSLMHIMIHILPTLKIHGETVSAIAD